MSMFETLLSGLDATSLIVFVSVFLICYYWMTTPPNLPPGPLGLPVIGNLLSLARAGQDIRGVMKKWRQRYGDVFSLRMGNTYLIVLNTYKMMQDTFVNQGDVFSGRPSDLYSLRRLIDAAGIGVVLNSGQSWKEMRRMTLMTLRDFGVGKKSLEQRVQEEARAVVEVLGKGQGQPVHIRPLMSKFSANIICSIVLGQRFNYDDATFLQIIDLANRGVKEQVMFAPANFLYMMRFLPSCDKMVERLVDTADEFDKILKVFLKDHEETYDPSEVRDFLDLYIKTRSETKDSRLYNAANMRSVITDLLIAGTETSATTVDWTILYLIVYPEVQERCQHEIDRVVGQGRLVTTEDRTNLPYCMAVITEIHRLVTIVPLGLPHVAEQEGKIGGYTVPAGSIVMANMGEIHHEATVWSDPDAFRPERFLDQDGQLCQPKDNYVPFSNGPRACLGEGLAKVEVFIILATLLQSFTFTLPEGHKPDLQGHFGVTNAARAQPVLAISR